METAADPRRELAIKRIKARDDFKIHAVTYVTINAMLAMIWFVGAVMLGGPFTFFWPILSIAIWGGGLIIHGYTVYQGDAYTEEQVQHEMKAMP
jgi:hypothetical protein